MTAIAPPPSGPAAAALIAAGAGSLALALLAMAADASQPLANLLTVWPPVGPLSGVGFAAVALWLLVWAVLGRLWREADVALAPTGLATAGMLIAALLLTFPPLSDALIGK